MKHKRILIIGGGIILALVVIEIALRAIWGFCDSPLCMTNEKFEYICKPSQHRHRFGNEVTYNSYSQRSEEPDSSKVIVLGLGDSVINGGVQTDQSELATTLASDDNVQVLNISAGSWGPDNCAAYLDEYGTFGAKVILLVVSSHDAHDIMNFMPIIGVHKSYPDKQYISAIWEALDRYIMPRIHSAIFPKKKKQIENLDPDQKALAGVGIDKGGDVFNPGFARLKAISDSLGIPMRIYLHPDKAEMKDGKFNSQGEEIIEWARNNGVALTSGFDCGENGATYRDGIHVNVEGQKLLSKWMKQQIAELAK